VFVVEHSRNGVQLFLISYFLAKKTLYRPTVFFCLFVRVVCVYVCGILIYIYWIWFSKDDYKKKSFDDTFCFVLLISSFMTSLLEGRIIIISRGFDVERIIILIGKKKQIIFNNCFCFS
jgi:hypothetical protein